MITESNEKCERVTSEHYARLREQIKREYGEKDLKMMESIALTLCRQDHDCESITFRLHYLQWIVSELKKKSKKFNIHTLVNDTRPNLYCNQPK